MMASGGPPRSIGSGFAGLLDGRLIGQGPDSWFISFCAILSISIDTGWPGEVGGIAVMAATS